MNIYIRKAGEQQVTQSINSSAVQQRKRTESVRYRDERTFCQSSANYDYPRKSLASCSVWYPDPAVHTVATYRNKAREK